MLKLIRTSLFLSSLVISRIVFADTFSIMGDESKMKGNVVVDVGNASKVDPPLNTKWVTDLYELNGRCFTMQGYYGMWGYGQKAALLLVNSDKVVRVAFIGTGIGSVDVDVQLVALVQCPAESMVIPYSDDPNERLKQIEKRRNEIEKKLKELEGGN